MSILKKDQFAPGIDDEQAQGAVKKYEKIPTVIFHNSMDASRAVAEEIAAIIKIKQLEGKMCVLGFPTGSTPIKVYEELVRLHQKEGLSFSNVVTFNLDEYYPMMPDAIQSYVRFMHEYLFDHIDILPENINIPDGTLPKEKVNDYCRQYEEKVKKLGGIDLQILGIGRTGHIGFNEPGSDIKSKTRLITLDHITRADAASDFFGEENVPRTAITMGVGSIQEAKRVILMSWGELKAEIIQKTVEGPLTDAVPATYLQNHPDATVVLDQAAAAELTRMKTPWLIGSCTWDDKLIRKATVWLCLKTGKPILKLTDRDYNDNGMSDLVADKGPAYAINIKVFNDLQHTITGWPGGKPKADDTYRPERANPYPKRVLVFSPHPDDDVISMGGTLIRLVEQGHEVHAAYQTSGNIAVFDDDVFRFAGFVSDYFHSFFPEQEKKIKDSYRKVISFLQNKKPGQIDSPGVQRIKALIREGEASAACRYVGIPDERIHFLNMPFYQTGLVKKKPIGKKDVEIIVKMLKAIKPHQVLAAGDLSDPHGTHRLCLDAILLALDHVKKEKWMKDCYVWLYRGAWQEWDISDIHMAVPLSPGELSRKIKAIFKHQSQKDKALFPGSDDREFWQRAEARNRATADLYNRVGMAEYEAFEAFVRYVP
jgi:glucosamine-6-phosphate deaminase